MNPPNQAPDEHQAPETDKRESHRVHYPIPERPTLFVGDHESYRVFDVSQRGLRYIHNQHFLPRLHNPMRGLLEFKCTKTKIAIEGIVVRANSSEVALHLSKEVPLNLLFAEQRYLLRHYPMWSHGKIDDEELE